ncbi:MAG TPA: nitroreductase family protein [Rhabdochlamydiaceae bacterium]|nr:nitroreductase family protein [Rhabdochlamydiaceae bacterium]
MKDAELKKLRTSDYPINPLILNRWSPRSMTGEGMTDEELFPLFEAARWAPSSYNNQPWIFIYAHRDTPQWKPLFDLMIEFNQSWTKNAAVLLVIVSKKTFYHNGKPSHTHSLDTGSAWMALALEGASRGYVVHGMEGFDYDKAQKSLQIPDDYQVEAMAAIGKQAPKEKLPPELQKREAPSPRRPIQQFIMNGKFEQRIEQA